MYSRKKRTCDETCSRIPPNIPICSPLGSRHDHSSSYRVGQFYRSQFGIVILLNQWECAGFRYGGVHLEIMKSFALMEALPIPEMSFLSLTISFSKMGCPFVYTQDSIVFCESLSSTPPTLTMRRSWHYSHWAISINTQ